MKALLPALLALLLLSGCVGYRLGTQRPEYMSGVQTVAVPLFENATLLPRLETLGANTLIAKIQQDGTLAVASEKTADAIVTVRIDRTTRRGIRSARSDIVRQQEYAVEVQLSYRVTDRRSGRQLTRGTVNGTTTFLVTGNDVNQDERQALPLALERAAVAIVARLTCGW